MDFRHVILEIVGVDEETDLHNHDVLLDLETYWVVVTDLGVGNYLADTWDLEMAEDLWLEA
jgi:hypothetical protein